MPFTAFYIELCSHPCNVYFRAESYCTVAFTNCSQFLSCSSKMQSKAETFGFFCMDPAISWHDKNLYLYDCMITHFDMNKTNTTAVEYIYSKPDMQCTDYSFLCVLALSMMVQYNTMWHLEFWSHIQHPQILVWTWTWCNRGSFW